MLLSWDKFTTLSINGNHLNIFLPSICMHGLSLTGRILSTQFSVPLKSLAMNYTMLLYLICYAYILNVRISHSLQISLIMMQIQMNLLAHLGKLTWARPHLTRPSRARDLPERGCRHIVKTGPNQL